MSQTARWRVTLVGLATAVTLGLCWYSYKPLTWHDALAAGHPARIPLDGPIAMKQLFGFNHTSPPPWPEGNSFRLYLTKDHFLVNDGPWVVNMHAENYAHLGNVIGLRSVELTFLDKYHALITDCRIPRNWFLRSIKWSRLDADYCDRIRRDYAEWFRGD